MTSLYDSIEYPLTKESAAISPEDYINIILCLLIFLGSIGYLVVFDVLRKIKYTHDHKFSYKKLFSKFTLNTKIILKTSFILIIAGALGIFILESFNKDSFGDLNTVEKILVSIFQSISARSAGITTINVGLFKDFDDNIFNDIDVIIHLAYRNGFIHNSKTHMVDLEYHKKFIEKSQ